jgi:hypothetical protein
MLFAWASPCRLISLAPHLRGEGWGEGLLQRVPNTRRVPLTRRFAPTSPRKRGEVIKRQCRSCTSRANPHFIGHLSWKRSWSSLTMVATVFSDN